MPHVDAIPADDEIIAAVHQALAQQADDFRVRCVSWTSKRTFELEIVALVSQTRHLFAIPAADDCDPLQLIPGLSAWNPFAHLRRPMDLTRVASGKPPSRDHRALVLPHLADVRRCAVERKLPRPLRTVAARQASVPLAYLTAHSWLCTRPSSKSCFSDGSDPCATPCSSWNCSVSVLPASAVVLDLPPEIAVATASK